MGGPTGKPYCGCMSSTYRRAGPCYWRVTTRLGCAWRRPPCVTARLCMRRRRLPATARSTIGADFSTVSSVTESAGSWAPRCCLNASAVPRHRSKRAPTSYSGSGPTCACGGRRHLIRAAVVRPCTGQRSSSANRSPGGNPPASRNCWTRIWAGCAKAWRDFWPRLAHRLRRRNPAKKRQGGRPGACASAVSATKWPKRPARSPRPPLKPLLSSCQRASTPTRPCRVNRC